MGINNLVKGRGFKNFMAKLYGWGAAVVILGALFKINHYPGADYMLILGLGTEAIIFFFSAFEPPHVEPDWSLVYPELAGMYHGTDVSDILAAKKGVTGELDKMLVDANVDKNLIQRLGEGLKNLSENTQKLSTVSDAAVASEDYIKNVKKASESVVELSHTYKKTSEALVADADVAEEYFTNMRKAAESASSLSSSYTEAAQNMNNELEATKAFASSIKNATAKVDELSAHYSKSTDLLTRSAEALDFSALEDADFNNKLRKISDNLSALNAVYELQLQHSSAQKESAAQLQGVMEKYLGNLTDAVAKAEDYSRSMDLLGKNVAALNQVYGNMLSAMNVQVK
jgi:gliding motility-associated protein GldL